VVVAGLAIGREAIRSNYYVTAHDGTVSIMRGVPGSILGLPLQETYRHGCLTARNELKLIAPGQSTPDCQPFRVSDLKQTERQQVEAGLPTGSEDDAIVQINRLAKDSVLPVCAPPEPPPSPSPRPSAVPHSPDPSNSPGLPNNPPNNPTTAPPSPGTETPAPETPQTVTRTAAPAPGPTPSPSPGASSPAPPAPSTPAPAPSQTVTALPPPPPEPGTNCRELS
jgi:protein phosphatase